jgi:DNA repair protein RadC
VNRRYEHFLQECSLEASMVKEQSHADELITKRIVSCLAMIDVRVLDLIVAGAEFLSFAEEGLL